MSTSLFNSTASLLYKGVNVLAGCIVPVLYGRLVGLLFINICVLFYVDHIMPATAVEMIERTSTC